MHCNTEPAINLRPVLDEDLFQYESPNKINASANTKATSNVSLKVPFNEKEQAKSLGARWNAEAKHWYVPQGIELAPFEKWLSNAPLTTPAKAATPKPAAKQAIDTNTSLRPLDNDLDAINAQLRDAYEPLDGDMF